MAKQTNHRYFSSKQFAHFQFFFYFAVQSPEENRKRNATDFYAFEFRV